MAVVDLLQAVHVQQHHGERPLGPLVALDLRVDRIGELAIVGEARQRIAHRQLPQPLLHLRALGHEGGERERHHRRDAHERLQQEERLVARRAHERTEPVQRPPDRDPRQHHDRARGLALREPERGPDKERKAQKLERIILDARWEQPTEHREAHYDHPEQQRRSLDPLGTIPPQAGGRRPQHQRGRDNQVADCFAEPPGPPDRTILGPARESGESERGHAHGGANGRADDAGEHREGEHVLRTVERAAPAGEAVDQVRTGQAFQGVPGRDAEGGRHRAGRRDVDEEGAGEDRRPDIVAEQDEGGEGDAGAGPDRGRAGVLEGKLEPELAGDDVHRGERDQQPHSSEPARLGHLGPPTLSRFRRHARVARSQRRGPRLGR